jgi:CRP-like cAMP-binding protein
MNAVIHSISRNDLQGLIQAVTHSQALDSFRPTLSPEQWSVLGSYLQPLTLQAQRPLIEAGTEDRRLYWLESGSLTVHREDRRGQVRMALLAPGAVVGEGAFFSHQPRASHVQAASDCALWCLTPLRFVELSNRQSALALALCLALGSVLARRQAHRQRRVAIT